MINIKKTIIENADLIIKTFKQECANANKRQIEQKIKMDDLLPLSDLAFPVLCEFITNTYMIECNEEIKCFLKNMIAEYNRGIMPVIS